MTIEKKIAQYIEKQFPSFYQEEGPQFIAFVKAYYDWLEEPGNVNHKARHLLEYRDIDTTMDEFLLYFKEKYLKNIQFDTATNKQLLVKNSLDLYRSKGTDRSVDLFFKLVFGTPAEVQYPGERIFKLSDGVWEVPKYLEVTYNKHNINYVGKQVIGSSSGATAFVEKYIRRRAGYGYVNMFYISGLVGTFSRGDVLGIKTNGAASYTPGQTATIIGSIDSVILQDNGMDFAVGDIVTFENSDRGVGGQARVTEIGEATGLIDFILHEGGWGYTTNATSIVSEKVATANGVYNTAGELPFVFMDTVYQPVLEMQFTTGPTLVVGDIVRRYNGANLVANGQVISVDQTVGSNTGNATIAVYKGPFTEGTLYVNANVATLNATSLVANVIGAEIMGVPDRYQLTLGDATGTFTVGMNVFQRNTEAIYGYGTIASVTPDTLVISATVGAFSNGQSLQVDSNSSINATVLSVDTTVGLYTITVRENSFTFTGANNTTIAESEYVYQYNATANAVAIGLALHTNVSSNAGTVEFLPIRGYFSSTFGPIYTTGNTAQCTLNVLTEEVDGGDFYEATNAHWVSAYSNTHFTVDTLSEGTGAEFNVGTIGETEVLYLNTDLLSAEGMDRLDSARYNLTAANTGLVIGDTVYQIVESNTVVGTVYGLTSTLVRVRDVDGTFVATSGANGNLILLTNTAVNTSITTAAIRPVESTRSGIPYMNEYIRASSLGWPKNPQGNYRSIIFDCLTFAQFTVGTIDSLTGLDPGSGYNVDPYVLVEQREIAAFGRHDYNASISNTNGSFVVGEKVSQSIANLTTYSLTVDHGVYTPAIEPSTIVANGTRDVNVTTDFIMTQTANMSFVPGRDVNYWTGAIADALSNTFTANSYGKYVANTGNTGVIANNTFLTITSANDTHIIVNTAITLSAQTFNPSTIVNNFILVSSNPYPNTTLLKYWVSSSNSEVFGLDDGEDYYAVEANSTGLRLSLTSGGAVVNVTAGTNETGHALVLQNTASSGHHLFFYSNDLPDGAMIRYQTAHSNTVITGLSNNTVYYVKSSNAVGYKLAATKAGAAVDLTSVTDESGHVFTALPGWMPLDAVYSNSGAYGIIDSVSNNTVVIKSVSNGTFAAPGTITSNTYSYLTANVSASDLEEVVRTAEALVKTANNSTLLLKRIQFTNLFDTSVALTGETSGANAILTAISEDTSSLPIGLNANVEANVITADGTVTALKIIDSGYGYTNSEIIQFTSVDGSRAGSAKVVLGGSGKGIGYYKSSKGFLSDSVCIHDGDYYQEYSYEIFSKLSLDRYHDMFKKVMHTAGTKFFGSARVVEEDAVVVSLAESSVTSE